MYKIKNFFTHLRGKKYMCLKLESNFQGSYNLDRNLDGTGHLRRPSKEIKYSLLKAIL